MAITATESSFSNTTRTLMTMKKNRRELAAHLNVISNHVESLPLSEPDAPNRLRQILETVANETIGGSPRITFDVSAAANRFVVTSMAILCESDGSLNVLYSEAATYHPTQAEYEAEPSVWQSESQLGLERGVGDVRPSREAPGSISILCQTQ